jgi:cell division protease FtsH
MVLPDQDKYSTTRSQMLNQLAYMLGGRAAEELVFHDPTTGAANDIEKATAVARAMVTQYGMTERLGAIRYGKENGEVFLGRDMGHMRDYSEEIAAAIDEEVRSLIDHAHNEAFEILVDNRDVLDALVVELLEKETLNKEQVATIFEPLRLRPTRPAWTGSERRTPSDRPPVDVPPRAEVAVSAGFPQGAYGLPAPAPTGQPLPPGGYGHPGGYPGAHPGAAHPGTAHPGVPVGPYGTPPSGPAATPGSYPVAPPNGGHAGGNGGYPGGPSGSGPTAPGPTAPGPAAPGPAAPGPTDAGPAAPGPAAPGPAPDGSGSDPDEARGGSK